MEVTTELERQMELMATMGLAEIAREGFLTSEMWIHFTGARYSLVSRNEARVCSHCKEDRHRVIEFAVLPSGLRDCVCIHCRGENGRPWKKIRMALMKGKTND